MLQQQANRMQRIENAINKESATISNITPARGGFNPRGLGMRGLSMRGQRGLSYRPNNQQTNNPRFQPRVAGQQNGGFRGGRGSFNRINTGNLSENSKFPNPVYPNRMDFCFYHRTFGREARKHELPCAWTFPRRGQ